MYIYIYVYISSDYVLFHMQKSINVAFYAIFAVVSRANIKYILPSIKSGFLSAFTQAFVYCY